MRHWPPYQKFRLLGSKYPEAFGQRSLPAATEAGDATAIKERSMNTSTPSTGLRGLIATGIFGALASSFSAVSAADPSSVSITVKFSDLNVADPSGALVLYERIRAAAQGACSYYWFKTDADEARCVQNAIANAVAKVNKPALSAVYNAKYKISAPSALVSQNP
jgi:UrcA family protein